MSLQPARAAFSSSARSRFFTEVPRATLQHLILEGTPCLCLRALVSGLGPRAAGLFDVQPAEHSAARVTTLYDLISSLQEDAQWRAYAKGVTRSIGFEAELEEDLRDRPILDRCMWVLLFWFEQWDENDYWGPSTRQFCLLMQDFKDRIGINLGALALMLQGRANQADKGKYKWRAALFLCGWLKHVDEGNELPASAEPKTPPFMPPSTSASAETAPSEKTLVRCAMCGGKKGRGPVSCSRPCDGGQILNPLKPNSPGRKRPRSPVDCTSSAAMDAAAAKLPPLPPLPPDVPLVQSEERGDVLVSGDVLPHPNRAHAETQTELPPTTTESEAGPGPGIVNWGSSEETPWILE
jgi:hypothetical protein